jgi:hypothetical protein
MALTLTTLQQLLLGIMASVESGVTSPEAGFDELAELKAQAREAGIDFTADYSVEDFQRMLENAAWDDYDEVDFEEDLYDDETFEDEDSNFEED